MGTCGWSYDEWEGVFYPGGRTNKLRYYADVFETAEVDSSFYAMPAPKTVFGWIRQSPRGFIFSMKLPKEVTHDRRLSLRDGAEEPLERFLKLIQPLRGSGRMGVLLAQLPPSLRKDMDLLERFLGVLPLDLYRFAVEFRHSSWWGEDTWRLLRRFGVANTIVDEPLLPGEPVVTAKHAYVRWHGRGSRVWYDYRYGEKELQEWAAKIGGLTKKVPTYAYWNNHFHGDAVLNCLQELRLLGRMTQGQGSVLSRMEGRAERSLLEYG